MSQIIYEDDRQIGSILMQKHYDKEPRTEIRIMGRAKTIPQKVEDILSNLSVEEFGELASDLEIVADCIGMDFHASDDIMKQKLQLEAAYTLSIFADKYGSMLHNINKKYPGIWKIISEYEKTLPQDSQEPYINGVCHPEKYINQSITTQGGIINHYG
jgi:hypothetical protein